MAVTTFTRQELEDKGWQFSSAFVAGITDPIDLARFTWDEQNVSNLFSKIFAQNIEEWFGNAESLTFELSRDLWEELVRASNGDVLPYFKLLTGDATDFTNYINTRTTLNYVYEAAIRRVDRAVRPISVITPNGSTIIFSYVGADAGNRSPAPFLDETVRLYFAYSVNGTRELDPNIGNTYPAENGMVAPTTLMFSITCEADGRATVNSGVAVSGVKPNPYLLP